MLALVILDDQVEPRGAVIEPELQLGLGERARHRLARLDLSDLLRQILGAFRVGRRQPQARAPVRWRPGGRTSPSSVVLPTLRWPKSAIRFGPLSRASRASSRSVRRLFFVIRQIPPAAAITTREVSRSMESGCSRTLVRSSRWRLRSIPAEELVRVGNVLDDACFEKSL